MTLTDFLLTRIADDEEVARNALHADAKEPGVWITEGHNSEYYSGPNLCHIAEDSRGHYWSVAHEVFIPNAEHMARHDPARVLGECEAKRLILAEHTRADGNGGAWCSKCVDPLTKGETFELWPCQTVRLLALPYRDHPDYREEWSP